MVKDFTDATGIKVQWDIMEEGYLRQKLLMEHQSKTGVYDVLMIDAFNLAEYSPSGVALPLKPFLDNKTLTPSWFDYQDLSAAFRNGVGAYNGTIYSVPIAGETRFLGYRKDLFDKYGKKAPQTLDEMLALAKFFNGKEPGLYGIAMRAQRGIQFASGWMTLMYSLGGEFLDQKTWKPTCNTPGTISSLKYYIELLKNAPPDVGVYTHEEAISAFMAGKTAMWFDATAIAPWILDPKKSSVYDKVAFAPPPAGPAGDFGVMAGWGIGISSDVDVKHQNAAWAFITWMTGKAIVGLFLGFYALLCFFPFFWMILTSLKERVDVINPAVWTFKPILDNYIDVFTKRNLPLNLLNSVIVVSITVSASVLLGTMAAYGFARFEFKKKESLAFWILSLRMLPPMAVVISFFILGRMLRVLDKQLYLSVIYMSFNIPFAIWMMRGYIEDIPKELEESAWLDGCSRMRGLFSVVVPLVSPGLIATAIFCVIQSWNEFTLAFFLTSFRAKTVPTIVTEFLSVTGVLWGEMSAVGVVAILPILIFAFLIQKQLIRGMTFGAMKE